MFHLEENVHHLQDLPDLLEIFLQQIDLILVKPEVSLLLRGCHREPAEIFPNLPVNRFLLSPVLHHNSKILRLL